MDDYNREVDNLNDKWRNQFYLIIWGYRKIDAFTIPLTVFALFFFKTYFLIYIPVFMLQN